MPADNPNELYLIPSVARNDEAVLAMGMTSEVKFNLDWVKRYPPGKAPDQATVSMCCRNPDMKHVSPGNVLRSNRFYLEVSAGGIAGMEGGPVVVLRDPRLFVGIYLGWVYAADAPGTDNNYNVVLSVTHPAFVEFYRHKILPELPRPLPDELEAALVLYCGHVGITR